MPAITKPEKCALKLFLCTDIKSAFLNY